MFSSVCWWEQAQDWAWALLPTGQTATIGYSPILERPSSHRPEPLRAQRLELYFQAADGKRSTRLGSMLCSAQRVMQCGTGWSCPSYSCTRHPSDGKKLLRPARWHSCGHWYPPCAGAVRLTPNSRLDQRREGIALADA